MNSNSNTRFGTGLRGALALAGVVALGACASTPPAPTEKIQAAQLAIANAERVDAGHFAAGELSEARTRLASAETAVKEKKMVIAERYAEESRADAELASAKTGALKAKTVNDDMKRATDTLIEEMQRKSGGTT